MRVRLASTARRALRQTSEWLMRSAWKSVVASSAQPSSASRWANQASRAAALTSSPAR